MLVWCSRAAARASRRNRSRPLRVAERPRAAAPSARRAGRATPARPRRRRPCRRGRSRGGCGSRPRCSQRGVAGRPPAAGRRRSGRSRRSRPELLDHRAAPGRRRGSRSASSGCSAAVLRRASGRSPPRWRSRNSSASQLDGVDAMRRSTCDPWSRPTRFGMRRRTAGHACR